MKYLKFSIIPLVLLASACAAQPATTQSSEPIRYRHERRDDPRLHLHIVEIDLSDPRVELDAYSCGKDPDGEGPWQMTLATVRETAQRQELDLAVNASFFVPKDALNVAGRRVPYFAGNWSRAVGWYMSGGVLVSNEPAPATLVVDAQGKVLIAKFNQLPAGTRHAVSGSQLLVDEGRVVGNGITGAPRTAAGINAAGDRLILLLVDGRLLSHSVGMTERELAEEMLKLGCHAALNLDGGGSSTLVMRNPRSGSQEVLNRPSDGHDLPLPLSLERNVACILGVRVREK